MVGETEHIKHARLVGGIASTQTDLIQSKECPKCAEVIKRRARRCKHCSYEYTETDYVKEQAAFDKHEDDLRQKERAAKERKKKKREEKRLVRQKERAAKERERYKGLVVKKRPDGRFEVKNSFGDVVAGSRAYDSIEDAYAFIDFIL